MEGVKVVYDMRELRVTVWDQEREMKISITKEGDHPHMSCAILNTVRNHVENFLTGHEAPVIGMGEAIRRSIIDTYEGGMYPVPESPPSGELNETPKRPFPPAGRSGG